MKMDFVDRATFFTIQSTCVAIENQSTESYAQRYKYLVVGMAGLVYPFERVAELVENIALTVINALGSLLFEECHYDALVYLRKSTISLINTALSPLASSFLLIMACYRACFAPHLSTLNLYADARDYYSQSLQPIFNLIPRPPIDDSKVIDAVKRELKFYARVGEISGDMLAFIGAAGDHCPLSITDEWGRFWEISNWGGKQKIVIRQLNYPYHDQTSNFIEVDENTSNQIKAIVAGKG
jgi:hypothetical protein